MWLVYARVVDELSDIPGARLHVITPDHAIRERLKTSGKVNTIHTDRGRDLSDLQAIILQQIRVKSPVIVMADLPLLVNRNLQKFLRSIRGISPDIAIVPSLDDPPGTSVLYVKDLEHYLLCYGKNSYWRHLEEARKRQMLVFSYRDPTMGFDIDTWEDVMYLYRFLCLFSSSQSLELETPDTKFILQRLIYLMKQVSKASNRVQLLAESFLFLSR